jgi:hypothetical protein
MNKKRLEWLCLLIGLLPATLKADLIITQSSGAKSKIALSDFRRITFSGSNLLTLQKDGTSNTYALSSLQKLYFGTLDGITAIRQTSLPAMNSRTLTLHTSAAAQASIYSIEGKLLQKAALPAGTSSVDISSLERGIYIVRIGSETFKIRKP